MVEPWMDFRNFLGVNNMADTLRIPVGKGGTYLEVGENIDIDDEANQIETVGDAIKYISSKLTK